MWGTSHGALCCSELLAIHKRVHLTMENLLLSRNYSEAERMIRHIDLHMAKLIQDTEIAG